MEKGKLIENIEMFARFTVWEKELIRKEVSVRKFKASDIFLEAGKKEIEMVFIVEGVFRFFYHDDDGNEVISSFLCENQYATILSAYTEISVSSVNIQAVTNATGVIISKKAWQLFVEKIPAWSVVMPKISSTYFVEKTRFQRNLITMNAEEAYKYFDEIHPSLLDRIPLSYVANYLGITPYSLSRIRKKIADENS